MKRYYANRRGPTYYKEKSIIENISEKKLPNYIEDLKKKLKEAPDYGMIKHARTLKAFDLMNINTKIKSITSDPNNRQIFGLFEKSTPELQALYREKYRIEEELNKQKSDLEMNQYSELMTGDLWAALLVAEKRLEQINSKRKKAEALKQKTSVIAEYEGKSRKVARSVKTKLPMNQTCPYCGKEIGKMAHADHIYPISKGGRSTISNMVYICNTCNIKKSDMTLREFILEYKLNRDMIERNLESLGKSF